MKKCIYFPFLSVTKNLIKNFVTCGVIVWCIEILFTAAGSLRRREMPLVGQTSLWMFPIYGSAAFFRPVFLLLKRFPVIVRGFFYAISIFAAEFISGRFLTKHHLCPWNYSQYKWHVNEVIRLDFLPFWFVVGLLYEKVLTSNPSIQNDTTVS